MMEKIDKGHPLSQSTDFVAQNIETLKTLFPTIVKEGKIDIKELQALLGDDVETEEEYYRFTWAGKSMARREANKPSTATLRPDKESSKDWDTTENIFIEGDNLEVLKLLQKSYANKIKLFYIDPPYNTGKDFVYKDNYNDNLGNYLAITGQVDEEGKRINTNSESDGRYHSNWLNMLYPRLRLARNLLIDSGVIFISIDESEIDNLKKLSNEIFGEDNFVCTVCVNRTSEIASNNMVSQHEYLLVYSKNSNEFKVTGRTKYSVSRGTVGNVDQTMPEIEFPKGLNCVNIPDGVYQETRKIEGSSENIENFEPIIVKNGKLVNAITLKARWRSSNDMRNFFNNNCKPTEAKISGIIEEIYFDGDRFMPQIKKLTYEKIGSVYSKNNRGSLDLERLELGGLFDFPKSANFIGDFIKLIDVNDGAILDFFAGSGTTAQAVMQLNSEDAGNRKFICVQLPEPTDEKSKAYEAGYKTISEITKERIRRAGEKIKSEMKEDLFSEQGKTLDVGFRAFKLDSSNIRAWDGNPDTLEDNLFNAGSNIKEDRTEEDVLYEILLKYGLDLTMPIEQKAIAGKQVFNIGMGALFICLGNNITTGVAEGIGKWKEELQPATSKVIFKDTGFTDVEKTNSMQILKRYGILEVNTI